MPDLLRTIRILADDADHQIHQKAPNSFQKMRQLEHGLTLIRDHLRVLYIEHSGEDPWSPVPPERELT